MGATSPDGLPYPSDYEDPADVPIAIKDLADQTQAALIERASTARVITAGTGLTGGGSLDTDRTIALDLAFTDGRFAPLVHGHTPSKVGITIGNWGPLTLAPGQEMVTDVGKPSGAAVFVTVQHQSTYIFATANVIDPTLVRFHIRNSTQSTTHTNVNMVYAIISAG